MVSDSGTAIQPTTTFSDCPDNLDVLFAPGGFGTVEAMKDQEVPAFLAERGVQAKYITSVCSGSLLLSAAGLLQGYQATSHWACRDSLSMFGAVPVEGRVVIDRNRISGGGIKAGIDFGLVLFAKLCSDETAKLTQLMMEYDPQPPFDAGSPKTAGPALVEQAMAIMASNMAETQQIAEGIGSKLTALAAS